MPGPCNAPDMSRRWVKLRPLNAPLKAPLSAPLRPALSGAFVAMASALVMTAASTAPPGVPSAVPSASAQSAEPAGSTDPTGLTGPAGIVDPAHYLPSPSPDPWYSDPPVLDESTPNGTILATRPGHIAWQHAPEGVGPTWQLLVQTRDSANRPVAVPSTVILPEREWPGPGPRPLLSFAVAIDALGNTCQPSWTLSQGFSLLQPPILQDLINRGYGVVVTDHQGPRGAYAASRMHGHALLDGIRAARSFEPAGLQDSPAALFGYSGGGIAVGGAAQVQNTYAPEMSEYLVANAIGGAPGDLAAAYRGMDGTIGAGLLRAAVFGVIREYPEAYGVLNQAGGELAHALRDTCSEANAASGVVMPPFATLTTVDDPLSDPRVQHMLTDTRVGPRPDRPDELPEHPVLLFHGDPEFFPGSGDQFFPAEGARELRDEWCAAGVNADYLGVPGEHIVGMFTATEPVLDWIHHRFELHAAGEPAPDGCRA